MMNKGQCHCLTPLLVISQCRLLQYTYAHGKSRRKLMSAILERHSLDLFTLHTATAAAAAAAAAASQQQQHRQHQQPQQQQQQRQSQH